jgi:DNA-binding Lrp family transcriptional regulator
MLKLEKHFDILKVLASENKISYSKLCERVHFCKKTFHKRVYELVSFGLVERIPPEWERKRGTKVWFRITEKGKKRVALDSVLVQTGTYVTNLFKEVYERTVEIAEQKSLIGQVAFFTSQDLPFFTIAHFPSESQYKKLKPLIISKEKQLELGMLINRVIEFYVTEKEYEKREVYADYVSHNKSVFTMNFLSKEQSDTMSEACERGLFSNYVQMMVMLSQITENMWFAIWKHLQDPRVVKGEKPFFLADGFRYNPSRKQLEKIPKNEVHARLKSFVEKES